MNYKKGSTLAVKREGIYNHFGIATGDGYVIHNSKGKGVIKSPELIFSKGGKVKEWGKITSENMQLAYEKAEASIGKTYDLFSSNCEHFVNYAHSKKEESLQLQRGVIVAGGAWAMVDESVPSEFKMVAGVMTAGSLVDADNPVRGAVKGVLIGGGALLLYQALSRLFK